MTRIPPFAMLVLVMAPSAMGETYVVAPDGSGDFSTIQEALSYAQDGDVVELTPGVFSGDGNRDVDFLGKAVTVRSQAMDPSTCTIECAGSLQNPHRGFWFHNGEGLDSRLEAITVRNGWAPGEQWWRLGGAILCSDGTSPRIRDCAFLENYAEDGGGAICCQDASPSIEHCLFIDNDAYVGGGVMTCWESYPTLSSCTFANNFGTFYI